MLCFLRSRAPQSTSVASPRGAMRRTASDAGRAAANLLDASTLPASDGLIRTARKLGSARPPQQQQQQQEVTKRTTQHALDALQPSVPPLGRRVRAKPSTQLSTDDGLARCASSCAALRWLFAPYPVCTHFPTVPPCMINSIPGASAAPSLPSDAAGSTCAPPIWRQCIAGAACFTAWQG